MFARQMIGAAVTSFLLGGCFLAYPYAAYDDELAALDNTPSCSVICGKPDHCDPSACFGASWGKRFGTVDDPQALGDLFVDRDGTVAMTGAYTGIGFEFAPGILFPSPGGESFFVAMLTSDNGMPIASATVNDPSSQVPARGRGIAMTNSGIMAVGDRSYVGGNPDGYMVRLDRTVPLLTSPGSWYLYGGDQPDSAVAIDTDGADAYIVGTMTPASLGKSLTCLATGTAQQSVKGGMYVMRVNEKFDCVWYHEFEGAIEPTALAATDAGSDGLWVAGTFTGTVKLAESLNDFTSAPNKRDAFLLHLDDTTGSVISKKQLSPQTSDSEIRPLSVTVSPAGTAAPKVYIGGQLHGPTEIKPDLSGIQTAGFVMAIDSSAPHNSLWSKVFPSGTSALSGAQVTDIVVDDQSVYLAGVFGDKLTLPAGKIQEEINSIGAHPFLARIRNVDQVLTAFHHFKSSGEAFNQQKAKLAKTKNGLIFGTTWQNSIDFSVYDNTLSVESFPGAKNPDIVLTNLIAVPR